MACKKTGVKAAWVLLLFFLLTGGGIAAARAGDDPGVQLVLVLDLPPVAGHGHAADRVSQAAGLLIRLLPDQAYLGLAAPGAELPAAQLGTAERREILDTLGAMKPPAQTKPFADMVAQSLTFFQPRGPEKRGLFIISDSAGSEEPEKKNAHLEEIAKLAAQARKAGVVIFAVSRPAGFSSEELQTLTLATGGRFWDAKTASDLITTILDFYDRLGQRQQAPLTGPDFKLDPWAKQAVVVAVRSVPGKAVMLTAPGGVHLTPRSRRGRTISWVAGQDYDLITLATPRPGVWSLTGAQPADSRVFLDTDLALTAMGVPRVVGADETLPVTAALAGNDKALAGAQDLAGTEFLAELQMNHGAPVTIKLQGPEPGNNAAPFPDARVGRFPPLHQEGDATLRISALGKTLQRSVELPITITRPWYRVALPTAAGPDAPPISFQPDVNRHLQQVEGAVTLQSAQGSLAGVLINPAPGAEIIMSQPSGCQDTCLANLQLTATAPGGRSLIIASGPRALSVPPAAPEPAAAPADKKISHEKAQAPHTAAGIKKSKRRWLWLALSGIGVLFFLGAGLLFWLEGREGQDSEEDGDPEVTSGDGDPRKQAQVDALLKEKAQLQAALEEKKSEAEQLKKEKADLQEELERTRARSEGSSKNLEELERRLEEAEQEAKGFQQEYMALYARSQEEKTTIKKN
jgi:hypothetical protein